MCTGLGSQGAQDQDALNDEGGAICYVQVDAYCNVELEGQSQLSLQQYGPFLQHESSQLTQKLFNAHDKFLCASCRHVQCGCVKVQKAEQKCGLKPSRATSSKRYCQ